MERNGTFSPFVDYVAPFRLLDGEGAYYLEFEARDLLGNTETTWSPRVDVESTPPTIESEVAYSSEAFEFVVAAAAEDLGSGLASLEYRNCDGSWQEYSGPFVVRTKSPVRIELRAIDQVGSERVTLLADVAPQFVNWKPLLAAVLAFLLLTLGLVLSRKSAGRRKVLVLVTCAIAAIEFATGIASWLIQVLLVSPFLGVGLFVDLAISAGGVATIIALLRQ